MLSDKIAYMRKLRKITERELSDGIGMSLTGFRQAMAKDDFKVSTIISIAKVLKVELTYFFSDTYSTDSHIDYANEFSISNKCQDCIKKDILISQKDEIIQDLRFAIQSLKVSLEIKENTINELRNSK